MKTVLQLNTSLFAEQRQSSKLTRNFIEAWRRRNPRDRIVTRDLASDPVPHLTAERFQAFLTGLLRRTDRGTAAGRRDCAGAPDV
jgi:FMN-dependent NADH-azoreductase